MMEFFRSGAFWFVEGILFVVVVAGVRAWSQDRGIPMPWWKWGVFIVWLALAGFTFAFVGTSLGEGEPTAALRGGILFGALTVIAGAGVRRLIVRGAGAADGGTTKHG
ncbi:MAG: dehalogenase [bacterium]